MHSDSPGAANVDPANPPDAVVSDDTTSDPDGMTVGLGSSGEHDADSSDAGVVRDDSNGTAVGDIGLDERQLSCNDGASRLYPYGGSYVSDACTVASDSVAPVGSRRDCATAGGSFDLSGNVAEWTDCCRSIDGILRCAARGGSYLHQNPLGVACNAAATEGVDPQFAPPYLRQQPHLGIRCYAD